MRRRIMITVIICFLCACSNHMIPIQDNIVIEYGTELNVEDLTDQQDVSLYEIIDFDSKRIGDQTIKVVFMDADHKETQQEIKLEVKDTVSPKITLKEESVSITQDDEFDPAGNIESVKDPVDGDIAISDDPEITKNGYVINNAADPSIPGEYTVSIAAYDINGNKAECTHTVVVEEKEEEPVYEAPVQNNSSSGNTSSIPQQPSGNSQVSSTPPTTEPTPPASDPVPKEPEPHVHRGPAIEGMYFDDPDLLDLWAEDYAASHPGIGAAYGVSKCTCGMYFIHRFY